MNRWLRASPSSTAGFLRFVWKHRVLIALVVGGFTVASIAFVLMVPVEYTARATLLPESGVASGVLSAARALAGGRITALGLRGVATEAVVQESVLKSDRLADLMNRDLGLDQRYHSKTRDARLRKWSSLFRVKTNRQGLLTVSYRDRDPEFAVQVVDRALVHLDDFNREVRSTSGRRARIFLEERLAESEARLTAIEDSLAQVQSDNRTVVLSTDAQKALSLGAELLMNRLQMETEIEMLRRTFGARAPALEAKEMEIAALDRELAKLPRLNSALASLMRAREAYEKAHLYLAAQLEEARLEEARNTPTVDILDPPVPPEEKSYPRRSLTVLATFSVSWLVALGAAYVREVMDVAGKAPEQTRV